MQACITLLTNSHLNLPPRFPCVQIYGLHLTVPKVSGTNSQYSPKTIETTLLFDYCESSTDLYISNQISTSMGTSIDKEAFFDPTKSFMNENFSDGSPMRISQFAGLLRSARYVAGRDIKTGLPWPYSPISDQDSHRGDSEYETLVVSGLEMHMRYVAVLLYLMLLDQIADIFYDLYRRPPTGTNPRNGIKSILDATKHVHSLTTSEIKAVVTLRHTLAHNFSLGSSPLAHSGKFRYQLDIGSAAALPGKVAKVGTFAGDYTTKAPSEITEIYFSELIDLIEKVIIEVISSQKAAGYPDILSEDELVGRFTTVIA